MSQYPDHIDQGCSGLEEMWKDICILSRIPAKILQVRYCIWEAVPEGCIMYF